MFLGLFLNKETLYLPFLKAVLLTSKDSMDTYKTLVTEFNEQNTTFIEKLWGPLKETFGIQLFEYRKFLPDGFSLGLITDPSWNELFCSRFLGHSLQLYEEEISSVSGSKETMFFRTGTPKKTDYCGQALVEHGFWNGFSLYKPHASHIEGFYFLANIPSPSGLNFYINHLDILHIFTTYFSHKIEPIMAGPGAQKLYSRIVAQEKYIQGPCKKQHKTFNDMLQSLRIEEFQMPTATGDKNVLISLREFQCLYLMSKGQTFKEIGKNLDLSPRTVESYINNLKSKTETNSKSELIKLYFTSSYRNFSF